MSIVLQGSTSGSITLQEPAVAGSNTINLPAATGTMALLQTPSFATTIGVGNATPSTSGAGITFPATQSASTDANTLDDYEEGTWSPTVAFGGASVGVTYDALYNRGWYTKVGNLVTCTMALEVTNKGSSTGTMTAGGFPFVSTQSAASTARNVITANINITSPIALYGTNSSGSYFVISQTTGSISFLTNTNCGTSISVLATITYLV